MNTKELLLLLNPLNWLRIMRRGAALTATFRAMHHREPTEVEHRAIAAQVWQELSKSTTDKAKQ